MDSRDRILSTFAKVRTDRIPVCLFIQDQGHLLNQLHPELAEDEYDALQKASVDFQREMGADVFLRILFDEALPQHVLFGGVNISTSTKNWQVSSTERQSGSTHVIASTIKTPDGTLTQEFSINRLYDRTLMFACTKKPVQCEQDLDIVMAHEPGMSDEFAQSIRDRVKRMKQYVGGDGVVGAWVPYGPFNNASHLIELDELYSLFLFDEEYYEKLMRFSLTRFNDYVRAYMDTELDAYFIGGNVPGGFMGKKNYDKYALPYEKAYIELFQSEGKPCIYHNCGQIMSLIDSYKELGSRIVEPFSPPPLGDTNLEHAVDVINGDYIMHCGVDQVNIIQKGTVEDVVEATRRTALAAKMKGCNIIQNADFFEYGTPIENIKAFVDTALRYGKY